MKQQELKPAITKVDLFSLKKYVNLQNNRSLTTNFFFSYRFNVHKCIRFCPEEALVEDAKHYFNRDAPSISKIIDDNDTNIKFEEETKEYMSPVVSAKFDI